MLRLFLVDGDVLLDIDVSLGVDDLDLLLDNDLLNLRTVGL